VTRKKQFVHSARDAVEIDVNLFVVASFTGLGVSLVEDRAVFALVVSNGINVIDEFLVTEHENGEIEIFCTDPAETAEKFGDVGGDDNFLTLD
jgi:energy-converting hydrogenase Eha subunit G